MAKKKREIHSFVLVLVIGALILTSVAISYAFKDVIPFGKLLPQKLNNDIDETKEESTTIDLSAKKSGGTTTKLEAKVEKEEEEIDFTEICDMVQEKYPVEFTLVKTKCILMGGSFVCEKDKAGCYNLNGIDSALCEMDEVDTVKDECESQVGIFTCNDNQISCEVEN